MLLVDISLQMRKNHAKLDFLKTTTGIPTGLEYGTLRTLEMLEKKFPDDQIVLCFDSPVNRRKQVSEDYKANRAPLSDEYKNRYKAFKKFLKCVYCSAEKHGAEADDVMYTLSRNNHNGICYIYSNDDDMLQAIDDELKVQVIKSWKSNLYFWDAAKVFEKYGVYPVFLPILRAFIGDGSDNLKGVERINKKYLAAVLDWCRRRRLNLFQILDEVRTADWSKTERARINEFITSGKFDDNRSLMQLEYDPGIVIERPVTNETYIVESLSLWEIMSLKLSEKYKDQLISVSDNDEF